MAELRAIRAVLGCKGRSEPRSPQTELVHVSGDFIFGTDGKVFCIIPNWTNKKDGSLKGSVTLTEDRTEYVGKPAKELLALLPNVRERKHKASIVVSRNALLSAIKNLNCDNVSLEIAENAEGQEYGYMLVRGKVTETSDDSEEIDIPVLSIVAKQDVDIEEIPSWFPAIEG